MTYSSTIWRVLSVVAIPLAIFLMISLFSAIKERNEAKEMLETVNAEYAALQAKTETQNAEIARLNAEAELSKAKYAKAKEESDKENKRLKALASTVKNTKGSSCADAMPIVDFVIAEIGG